VFANASSELAREIAIIYIFIVTRWGGLLELKLMRNKMRRLWRSVFPFSLVLQFSGTASDVVVN
jgi:DMSO reductase anchor subunit